VENRYTEDVKNYTIHVDPSCNSGWIQGRWSATPFIQYDDGSFAFDHPGRVPGYVRKKLPAIINRAKAHYGR